MKILPQMQFLINNLNNINKPMNYFDSLSFIAPFIPNRQLIVIQLNALPNKEESEYFTEKVKSLAALIKEMPEVYEQDGKGDGAIVYLHYFYGSSHWYITEKDSEKEQNQAFGYADLGYGGELGHISLAELKKTGVELDLNWEIKTLGEVKNKNSQPEETKSAEEIVRALDFDDGEEYD
jgi:hypothetical protein